MALPFVDSVVGAWDASELSSLTNPNSSVTEWRDISGNNIDWTNFSATLPSHDTDHVVFAGANNQSFVTGTPIIPATGDWTVVFRIAPIGGGSLFSQSTNSSTPGGFQASPSTTDISFNVVADGTYPAINLTATGISGRKTTIAVTRSGATFSIYTDGVLRDSITDAGLRSLAQNNAQLGRSATTGQEANNNLYRIGVWAEGYSGADLAQLTHWANTGNDGVLGSDAADYSLLLDATDNDSITTAGGSVSEWRDISGNARHYLQTTGIDQPTNSTLGVITFNSGDWLNGPIAITETGDFVLAFRSAFFNPLGARTLFSQFQTAAGGAKGQFLLDLLPTGQLRWYIENDGVKGGAINLNGGTLSHTTTYTIVCQRVGNAYTLRVNGAQVATSSDTGALRKINQYGLSCVGARDQRPASTVINYHYGSIKRVGLYIGTADADTIGSIERIMARGFATGTPIAVLTGGF